jgi:tetratricopeptide (TPR) repeat protein
VTRGNFSVAWQFAGHPMNSLRESDAAAAIERRHNPDGQVSDVFMANRGLYLERVGRLAEAQQMYQKALELSGARGNLSNVAVADAGLALVAIEGSRFAEARLFLQDAERHLLSASVRPGTSPSVRYKVVSARLAAAEGRLEEAREILDEIVVDLEAAKADLGNRLLAIATRADLALRLGQIDSALADALMAQKLAEQVQGTLPHSYFSGVALVELGKVRMAQGHRGEAAKYFERAAPHFLDTLGEDHPALRAARELAARARGTS